MGRDPVFRALVILLVGLSVLVSGCHRPIAPGGAFGSYERRATLFAVSEAGTAKLSFDATTDSDAVTLAPVDSGAQTSIGTFSGRAPSEYAIPFKGAVAQDYFLNLSKPINGTVFVSSKVLQAGASDTGRLVFRLHAGPQIVAIFEYTMHVLSTKDDGLNANLMPAWLPVYVQLRPEVHRIEKGTKLELHVQRDSGLADFQIGTGGDHQSWIEFRYFDFDPLSGVLYLENGHLISSASGQALSRSDAVEVLPDESRFASTLKRADPGLYFLNEKKAGPESSKASLAAWLFLPLGAIGLRRDRRLALGLLLLVSSLSGCAQAPRGVSEPTPADSGVPTFDAYYAPGGASEDRGSLQGWVRAAASFGNPKPIRGADVILVGTPNYTKTDGAGRFWIGQIVPGDYILRIQTTEFPPFEHLTSILPGTIATVNVTLVRPEAEGGADAKPHVHPTWPGPSKVVLDTDVQLKGSSPTAPALSQGVTYNGEWNCLGGGGAGGPVACVSQIPAPTQPMLPGTGLVEVNLTWSGSHAPKTLGLLVTTSTNTTQSAFGQRPQGVPFHIPIFPHEADPGHATVSRWSFWVTTPPTDVTGATGEPVVGIANIHIRVVIYRGIVPYEPPHPDFWNGRTQIAMFSGAAFYGIPTANSIVPSCNRPSDPTRPMEFPAESCRWDWRSWNWNSSKPRAETTDPYGRPSSEIKYYAPVDFLVPQGTSEIRGFMEWFNGCRDDVTQLHLTCLSPVDWNIAYRPANAPDNATPPVYQPVTVESKTLPGTGPAGSAFGMGNVSFVIKVKPEEVDTFYQTRTNWKFYVSDGEGNLPHDGFVGFLTATAFGDPSYTTA